MNSIRLSLQCIIMCVLCLKDNFYFYYGRDKSGYLLGLHNMDWMDVDN